MKAFLLIPWLALSVLSAPAARAVVLLPDFTLTPVVSGLSNPTTMAFAPDGRLFVCEQGGTLRVIKDGTLLAQPFLSVSVDARGERGLLGVTFDPDFATNQYVYVYYTTSTTPIHNRVSRFTAAGDVAAPGSETVLMDLDNLSTATNHNGGALHFGLDGKLYVAVGENARGSNAQTLANRLGKLLRINKDGSIPTDNPFYDQATGENRSIWALGLRNPYTFAVQPGTGRIFINDVGQNTWEEINDGIAGSNYGWPNEEGIGNDPAYRNPLYAYAHDNAEVVGCAISGGAFYNTPVQQFPPAYNGSYFFADLCGAWIRSFNPATGESRAFAAGLPGQVVDVRVGPDGALYFLARSGGGVGRIAYVPPRYTADDASAALKIAGGLLPADADTVFRLDADRDGVVDLRDVALIRKGL